MTIGKRENHSGNNGSCANRNSPNLWIIAGVVVALVSFFCYALFSNREKIPSVEDMPHEIMAGAQQAAFVPPGCATCPTVTNCFPGATLPAQQAAFNRPNCPIRSYGSPNYSTNAIQPVAFNGMVQPMPGRAPVIFRDALMPHEYRGVCELCHVVQPDIAISINAQMPHVYRGVCSNCHLIQGPVR